MDAATAVAALAAEGFRSFEFIAMPPHLDPRRASSAVVRGLRRAVEQVHGEVFALDLPSNDINLASTSVDVGDAMSRAIALPSVWRANSAPGGW